MLRFLLFLVFINTSAVWGQQNITFGVRPEFGFLIAHRPVMKHLPISHSRSGELFMEFQTDGSKDWHHVYGFPSWGVGGYFSDVGSPEMIGKAATLYSYFNFHFVKRKSFQLLYRLGAGVGWVQKSFDLYNNRKNIAIGSSINGTMTMALEARHRIGRIVWGGGLHLMHFSNGAWKMPNLGINVPSLQVFAAYSLNVPEPQKKDPELLKDLKEKLRGEYHVDVLGFGGLKEIQPIGGPKYPAFGLLSQVSRSMGPKGDLSAGFDIIYNSSHIARLEEQGDYVSGNMEIIQPGINIGYSIKVDRLRVLLNQGFYLHSRYDDDGIFYHRLGVRYYGDKGWIANLTLKTHFAVADYVEFGVGYRLK